MPPMTLDAPGLEYVCDLHVVVNPPIEVSTPRLQWMTESLFVGSGARDTASVHTSLYRLV